VTRLRLAQGLLERSPMCILPGARRRSEILQASLDGGRDEQDEAFGRNPLSKKPH
jgi:hypothetical protein